MPLGRLLNINQVLAGIRPAPAAQPIKLPGGIVVPAPATPAVVVAPPAAPPVAAPPVVAPAPAVRVAPPFIPGAVRVNPAILRAQPAIVAQLEGRTLRPRLNDLRPDLFPIKTGGGFGRGESQHPISPTQTPDDRCLYESPNNPQQRYWLPRYRLRNANGRYEITVAEGQNGLWAVSLGLETYPAPEIADAARTAQMLEVTRSASVTYRVPGTAIEQRLPAGEVQKDATGCVVMLQLSLADRDGLLRAFMSNDAQCKLVLSRGFTVAVPLPAGTSPDVPKRQLMMVKGQMQLARAPLESAQLMSRAAVVDASMVAKPAVTLDPGITAKMTASMAPMRAVGVKPPVSRIPISTIKARRFDGTPIIVQPEPMPDDVPPPPAPETRYEISNQVQDWAVALFFEPQLHPYLYPAGSASGPQASRWVVHALRYPAGSGRSHAYFQDLNDPARIFYLPDAFKLARRSEAPHAPSLVFQVDQGDNAEQVMVDLTCEVRPVTDGERLLAARRELADKVPASAANPNREFELRLLRAKSSLQMAVLRNGAVRSETVAATIDWDNGFTVNERFEFKDFQDVFGVLMAASNSNLLQGSVVVTTGINENVMVPVKLNFADMEGELFQSIETPDPQTGAVAVKLLNATESKLRITQLPTWITRGEGLVVGRIEGLDLSQPVEVEPEQSLQFTVQPTDTLSGNAPADAIFNTASVRSIPDGEAILKYTLDDTIDQETFRAVTVMTAPEVLQNIATGSSGGPILNIIVEFRGNRRVVLGEANQSVDIDVPVPLMDILLRKDSEGFYEYRQTVVFKSGQKSPTTPWRRDDAGVLFVTAV
ncbi:hypothetical protein [Lysobacter capsici]|uniref:hypothetical protein n=2 Tax=Lysobacter capsici TaxID=435897 RepID=UPI00287BC15A|nr:hypothetical protein [Lysobacter capsici]WND81486.1 hypothetical protein RJ610_03655 [Lysobacter capsici]WND86682.1 hypothetical protein RJ609_03655 [Lysobacter capsici]